MTEADLARWEGANRFGGVQPGVVRPADILALIAEVRRLRAWVGATVACLDPRTTMAESGRVLLARSDVGPDDV